MFLFTKCYSFESYLGVNQCDLSMSFSCSISIVLVKSCVVLVKSCVVLVKSISMNSEGCTEKNNTQFYCIDPE